MYAINYKEAAITAVVVWIAIFGACYMLEKRLENADYTVKIISILEAII